MFFLAAAAAGCEAGLHEDRALRHYVRGKLLFDQNELDAALLELSEAVKSNPTLSVAHSAIGDVHRRRGSYDLACRSYETACGTNPYAFRPHYNLGVTFQLLAEATKTVEKFRNYIARAIRVYLRAITIQPRDFDTNLNLSACYFQLGKYDLAEQYCQNAVHLNPRSPHAYSNLGIIYDSQNRLWEAIKAYKDSLELDSNQPEILLNLGSTYMRQNRLNDALRIFKIASRRAPGRASPHEQMGVCHYHMGNYPKALECYEKAISLNPNSAVAYRGAGVVYITQYVMDRTRSDLRDRGLGAWLTSLELEPGQEDLERLVQKYQPKYRGPGL